MGLLLFRYSVIYNLFLITMQYDLTAIHNHSADSIMLSIRNVALIAASVWSASSP